MKTISKLFAILSLLAILLSFATPAYAFDGRSGEDIVINQGEVINDDLYIGARSLTLNGTVKGDLIVGAQTVIINGVVEGDLIAGAQTIVVNGTVGHAARLFAAAMQVGEGASIGSDLVAMGASVEVKAGSTVGADLVTGSAQALLAGEIGRNVLAGTHALELRGPVGGSVRAYVDANAETAGEQPLNLYMTDIPITLPAVKPGLTIAQGARIAGNLLYSSSVDLSFPAGVVAGKITRQEVVVRETGTTVTVQPPTAAEQVGKWAFGLLRTAITLILFGLLLGWLFPKFMKVLPENLRAQPITSLGWGAILYAAVFFTVLAVILATVLLALIGLRWNVVGLGWLILSGLGIAFLFATAYLSKIVVGEAIGKWILGSVWPSLAEHRVWPMVTGVVVLVLVIGLLRFPLLPLGFFGWVLSFVVVLFGLGALWVWGRNAWASRKALPAAPVAE